MNQIYVIDSILVTRKKLMRIFRWLKNRKFLIEITQYWTNSQLMYDEVIEKLVVRNFNINTYDGEYIIKIKSNNSKIHTFYVPVDAEFKNIYNPKGTKFIWSNGDGTYSFLRIVVIDERVEDQRGLRKF